MKVLKKARWAASLVSVLVWGTVAAAAPSIDLRDAWRGNSGNWAKAAKTGAGFSFRYDNKAVGPDISGWRQSTVNGSRPGITNTVLTHASGLVVTREMRVFADSGAVEYKLRFKNAGNETLPPVSSFQALNLSFDSPALERARMGARHWLHWGIIAGGARSACANRCRVTGALTYEY
jgi:hypothetical protein